MNTAQERPDEDARRAFWTRSMENARRLIEQMERYPVLECHEPLVSIPQRASAAGVEMLFSRSKLAGQFDRIHCIREGIVDDLVSIGRVMNERGWILKIQDGFRTRDMQMALGASAAVFDQIVEACRWENHGVPPSSDLVWRRSGCLVANLPCLGTHMSGAAVDISVWDRDTGAEVGRGAGYLDMSETTPMASPFISAPERENRQAITAIMERHGFLHYPGEFWHYNQGDALYQILAKTGRPASYGPVNWDARTGAVTPQSDASVPLIAPVALQQLATEALARIG